VTAGTPSFPATLAREPAAVELFGSGLKDRPELLLRITESGLDSSVGAAENNGKELRRSRVLRRLKAIGPAGKNGQEPFPARPEEKPDSKMKRGKFAGQLPSRKKKEPAHSGSRADTTGPLRLSTLREKNERSGQDDLPEEKRFCGCRSVLI
jgi:hypothetical protein